MSAGDKLALAMIPEIDIWRAASLMLKRYGEKIAAGLVQPDAGDRFAQPGATIHYLPQDAARQTG
jgi:hypothetical protein